MKTRQYRTFVGDFETTVYEEQTKTEVWASALVEMNTEDVAILSSIEATFNYMQTLNSNLIVYYHNLKFDGAFWLDFLMRKLKYKQAYTELPGESFSCKWKPEKEMYNKTFKYSISDRGQWYTIVIKVNNHIIELRDSLKLLPYSVKKIGKSFGTKHKKLDMEYKGYRYPGCEIKPEEKEYIANDVLVVKEGLEIMFEQGHNRLTIGSCCLAEYKKIVGKEDWKILFPQQYDVQIKEDTYGSKTAGHYVHKSYHGGWCYVVKGKEGKIFHNGVTADVNSLYPSMMHSQSGNRYPTGLPHFWKGNTIPKVAIAADKYYFVRFKCRFNIKEGMLPFVQIKGTGRYKGTEMLETSDIRNVDDGKYYKYIQHRDGTIEYVRPELTMTMSDWELFNKHYNIEDLEILDGVWYFSQIGLFDEYIDKYKEIKMNSEGAVRESAKFFLNNLYGKFAASTSSSFKVAFLKPDGNIGFLPVHEEEKEAGYIPIGSAITSYSRCFTITAAQENYYGPDNPGFIYADTDSIHCDLPELKGVKVSNTEFCHWKLECRWDEGIFTRQKTYIEHVIKENEKDVVPYYNVKCAGMPDKCKQLFVDNVQGKGITPGMSEEEKEFMRRKLTVKDFRVGLKVPGKLMPTRIEGGILLKESLYSMH